MFWINGNGTGKPALPLCVPPDVKIAATKLLAGLECSELPCEVDLNPVVTVEFFATAAVVDSFMNLPPPPMFYLYLISIYIVVLLIYFFFFRIHVSRSDTNIFMYFSDRDISKYVNIFINKEQDHAMQNIYTTFNGYLYYVKIIDENNEVNIRRVKQQNLL